MISFFRFAAPALMPILLSLIMNPSRADAQSPPRLPSQAQPGRTLNPAPFDLAPPLDLELSIPAPQRSPVRREVDDIEFQISDVAIVGNTAFDRSTLDDLIAPILGHPITIRDLTAVADAIEARYRDAGYVLTRCFVPAQRISGSTLRLQVVEGFIKEIVIEGAGKASAERIRDGGSRLTAERPMRLATLESFLLAANQLPGVTATGTIRPGAELGASNLIVNVSETPVDGLLFLSSRGSRYSGHWSLTGEVSANDAFGGGERLTLDASTSLDFSRSRSASLKFDQPILTSGFNFGFEASYSDGEPGYTLAELNAHTVAARGGPHLSYDWLRTRRETLVIDLALLAAAVESDEQGEEISHDDYRLIELKANYSTVGWGGVTGFGFTLDQGLPVLGASRPNASPFETRASRFQAPPDFTKFYVELHRSQPIYDRLSAALYLSGQYALNTLYASEEYTVGGAQIGRGYDPADIAGDHGIGGAMELRWTDTIDFLLLQNYEFYAFYDSGKVWQRRSDLFGHSSSISSAGGGVRLTLSNRAAVTLEVARPLTREPADGGGGKPTRAFLDASIRF
jgi:hemolysin activation/secretion protein